MIRLTIRNAPTEYEDEIVFALHLVYERHNYHLAAHFVHDVDEKHAALRIEIECSNQEEDESLAVREAVTVLSCYLPKDEKRAALMSKLTRPSSAEPAFYI